MGFASVLLRPLRRRRAPEPDVPGDASPVDLPTDDHIVLQGTRVPVRRVLVDAGTRTFWAPGSTTTTTLVEAPDSITGEPMSRRLAALTQRHRRIVVDDARPRANPAFAEALFVELMRARQFLRAYEQLAPDCRSAWGSAERFAAAQRHVATVQGVSVRKTRILGEWTDPDSGLTHGQVAELEVEYTLGQGERQRGIERTVHLVPEDGKWRSLCYPFAAGEAAG